MRAHMCLHIGFVRKGFTAALVLTLILLNTGVHQAMAFQLGPLMERPVAARKGTGVRRRLVGDQVLAEYFTVGADHFVAVGV